MKLSLLISLLALIGAAACGKHTEPAPPPAPPVESKPVSLVAPDPTSAIPTPPPPPSDAVGALTDAAGASAPANSPTTGGDPVDLSAINQAIDSYIKKTGKEPTKLEDLVSKGFLAALPVAPPGMKLRYDFAAVRVFMVPDNGGK